MRTLLYFLLAGLLTLSFGACGSGPRTAAPAAEPIDSLTLKVVGQKRFKIDGAGGVFRGEPFQFYTSPSGKEYLVAKDRAHNALVWFDFDSEQVAYRTTMDLNEGPNAIGELSSFYVHTEDSIFLLPSWGDLVLVDRAGTIKAHYPYKEKLVRPTATPYASTDRPMYFIDGVVWLPTIVLGTFEHPNIVAVAINTGDVKQYMTHPRAVYDDQRWGGLQYNMYYYHYNPGTGNFLYSYAAAPFVVEASADHTQQVHHHAVGRMSGTPKPPFASEEAAMNTPNEVRFQRFMTATSYGSIFHDPYRKLYYRVCYGGNTVEDMNSDDIDRRFTRPVSLLLMDEAFRVVGEVELPRFELAPLNSHFRPDGIYMHSLPQSPGDEDYLSFTILVPASFEGK